MDINKPQQSSNSLRDTFTAALTPKQQSDSVKTTFTLPIELHKKLKLYAAMTDSSMNDIVTDMLREHIPQLHFPTK